MAQGQKTLKELRAEKLGLPVQRDAEGTKSIARAATDEGLAATPASPLGAQTTLPGTTPDQAKMAGTPAAMKNALGGIAPPVVASSPAASATAPGEIPAPTLSSKLRQKGVEATAPKETQQDIDNHYRIEEAKATAGSFGESAERLIQSFVPKVATPTYAVDTAAVTAAGLNPEATKALEEFAKSSRDAAAVITLEGAVAKALPGYDAHGIAGKNFIKAGTAADAVTQETPDKVMLNDDTLGNRLGISRESAAKLFPPGTDLSTKSLADLQEAAASFAHRGESEMEDLRQAVTDPAAGKHERNAAAQELLARGGFVQATEADAEALDDAIDEGLSIQVGDTRYTVADLLDDKQMSGIIDRLLREPPDSPFRKEMEAKLPGLVKFTEAYAAALSQAASALQDTQKKVIDLQDQAQKTWNTLSSSGLSPDLLKSVLGEDVIKHLSDPYAIAAPDTSKLPPVAAALLDPKTDYGLEGRPGFVKRMSNLPAGLLKELATLTPAELAASGFVTGGDAWKAFNKMRDSNAALNDTTKTIEQRLAAAFGGDFSFAKAQTWLDNAKMLADVSGDTGTLDELNKLFDVNHDGKLDSEKSIIGHTQAVLGEKGAAGIKQFLGGRGKGAQAWEKFADIGDLTAGQQYAAMIAGTKSTSDQDAALAGALTQPADGPARNLTHAMLGPEDKGMWTHLDDAGKESLKRLLSDNADLRVATELASTTLPTGAPGYIPPAAYPGTAQEKLLKQPARDPMAAAASLTDDELARTADTWTTLRNKGFQGEDTPDHPKSTWTAMMGNMARMIAAATALREFRKKGLPPAAARKSIGQMFADPLGLAKRLPDGPIKDAIIFSQEDLAAVPTDALIDSLGGESGREQAPAGGQGGAGSGVVGYDPNGAPIYGVNTDLEGTGAPIYVDSANDTGLSTNQNNIYIPEAVAPPAPRKGKPAPKRVGGKDANPG